MPKIKKAGLIILSIFYLAAGINHFWHPDGYVRIMPAWIPLHAWLNILAGLCEITFALMLFFKPTRPWAGWLIVIMLTAFLPVHIDMVINAPLYAGKFLVTPLIAWVRLLLQPLLMYWAWRNTRPGVSRYQSH